MQQVKKSTNKIALILGAGDGLGSAIAKEFSKNNFTTIVCRREKNKLQPLIDQIQSQGQQCYGYGVDAANEEQMTQLIKEVESTHGPIEVGVFNVGMFQISGIQETSATQFMKMWQTLTFAGFLFGQKVSEKMLERQNGTILYTGASASLRGQSGFSALASAKGGLRNMAMSMSKELGSKNIHVGHVIIDGILYNEDRKDQMKSYIESSGYPAEELFMHPENAAKAYYYLYTQPRNAWSFELDVRPNVEKW